MLRKFIERIRLRVEEMLDFILWRNLTFFGVR
jgi:hypothetical protein